MLSFTVLVAGQVVTSDDVIIAGQGFVPAVGQVTDGKYYNNGNFDECYELHGQHWKGKKPSPFLPPFPSRCGSEKCDPCDIAPTYHDLETLLAKSGITEKQMRLVTQKAELAASALSAGRKAHKLTPPERRLIARVDGAIKKAMIGRMS